MQPFKTTLLTLALLAGGCGTEIYVTGQGVTSDTQGSDSSNEDSSTSSGTTGGDNETSTSSESGSSSTSSSTTGGDNETTGNPFCQVSCQEVLELSNNYDPDELEIDPCFKYGQTNLNWAGAVELVMLSERAGSMCWPFHPMLWDTDLNVTSLAQMGELQAYAVTCFEFLGINLEIPENWEEPVCFDQVQPLVDALEELHSYQTRIQMPDGHLPDGGNYQGIMRIDVGTLSPLLVDEFGLGVSWDGTPPEFCRLRMDNIVGGETLTWTSGDQPIAGDSLNFKIPNQSIIPVGHNVLEIECVIGGQQIGDVFSTNGALTYQGMVTPQNKEHNLYNDGQQQTVIGP